ncbi:MAG: HAD family hydrolase [Chloroflexota bacterium]|nr:HAD family hydrolase [Chloroflexota bacterium]
MAGESPSTPGCRHAGNQARTLLFDADDTLWENNVYFLHVTERFLDVVERHQVDRESARRHLTETERRNIPQHGYGSRSFAVSMIEAFRELARQGDPTTEEELRALGHAIFNREIMELLPGAEEALRHLSRHCRLILVTKGDHDEQVRKLDRSGLAEYFDSVEVVPEKNEETYRKLVKRLQLSPESTWMIGNSPRSDINPALAAGLNAILVPHPSTWELELEEVVDGGERLMVVDNLGEVMALFVSPGGATADTPGSDPGTPRD